MAAFDEIKDQNSYLFYVAFVLLFRGFAESSRRTEPISEPTLLKNVCLCPVVHSTAMWNTVENPI